MDRSRAILIAGALAVCLIAGSPPRVVGDGGEYLAQALNFASFHGPSIGHREIPAIEQQVSEAASYLDSWRIDAASFPGRNGGRDFVHFWFYAFLATPAVWLMKAVHLPPVEAFTVLNVLLLGLALWMALPRIGTAAALLLFAGPIVWWIDKAHTEVFTFSLLTIVFLTLEARPWWAMIAAGAASTQNPPIALVAGFVAAIAVLRRRDIVRDRRFMAGAIVAVALSLLHPVYTYWRHGTVSLLLATTRPGMPTLAEIAAVIVDPTIGLVGNYPMFLVVIVLAVMALAIRAPQRLVTPGLVVALASGAIFLLSFARTGNLHHGGTPSLSRYAIWLMPLSVPLFEALRPVGGRVWRGILATGATVSAIGSVFAFHPGVPQYSREPTWLATYLWTVHPSWNNPLPEVFADTNLHLEQRWLPVATGNCEKILIGGHEDGQGLWPIPCYPERVPDWCLRRSAMCYANLRGEHYDFVPVPGRAEGPGTVRQEWTWPAASEAPVRALYEAWRWAELGFHPAGFDVLRQAQHAHVAVLGNSKRFMLVLDDIKPEASIFLRPPGPMNGSFVDPLTGTTVADLQFDAGGGDDQSMVPVPPGFSLLIFTAREEAPK